jgi:hypothetical protein
MPAFFWIRGAGMSNGWLAEEFVLPAPGRTLRGCQCNDPRLLGTDAQKSLSLLEAVVETLRLLMFCPGKSRIIIACFLGIGLDQGGLARHSSA